MTSYTNQLLLEGLDPAESRLMISKIWEEYGYWYCTLQSSEDKPKANFSMDAIITKNGIKYVLLSLPPPFSSTSEKQYSVLRISDGKSLHLVTTDVVESLSDELSRTTSESRIKKSTALKMCFGSVVEPIT